MLSNFRNSVSKYNSHYKCSKERIKKFKNADFRWLLSSGFQPCKPPKEAWKLSLEEKPGCAGPTTTPSPAHPAHSAAVTLSDHPALGTRRSKLLINQGRAGGSQTPPGDGSVSRAPARWANAALTSLSPGTNSRESCALACLEKWAHCC